VSAQLTVPAAASAAPVRRAVLEAAAVFAVTLVFFRWKLGQWSGFADYDGHYLAYGNPARSAIWLALLDGVADDPATVMISAFGARFAVIARRHGKLAEQLMGNPRAVLLLTAPEGWLFELR
jgi:hypothetical protein